MKQTIRAILIKFPWLYHFILFIYSPLKRLSEPKLKAKDLTSSEQAIYEKLKKAFK
jgi:hypothetical protein